MNRINVIFVYFTTSQVILNFERKIAAFLLVWDAETKHLIGCKRVVAAVYAVSWMDQGGFQGQNPKFVRLAQGGFQAHE